MLRNSIMVISVLVAVLLSLCVQPTEAVRAPRRVLSAPPAQRSSPQPLRRPARGLWRSQLTLFAVCSARA